MLPRRTAALLLVWILFAGPVGPARGDGAATAPPLARRVVSMNPSLTSTLVALDAASLLVGVEEHSARLHPRLRSLPVVGGLFNPSLEAVVALEPDLVVLVPSAEQRDFRRRLEALGVDVLVLPNVSVDDIVESIRVLGERVGRREAARRRIAEIRRRFSEIGAASAGRRPVRAVVVLQRDPLYVVGSGSFIDEMLGQAGVVNVGRELREPYPRAAVEWLIAAAPELILDASDGPPAAVDFWKRWPSIPAVANGHTDALPASVTFPGPFIDHSLELIAERVRSVADPAAAAAHAGARP